MCCFIGGLGGLWRMLRKREDTKRTRDNVIVSPNEESSISSYIKQLTYSYFFHIQGHIQGHIRQAQFNSDIIRLWNYHTRTLDSFTHPSCSIFTFEFVISFFSWYKPVLTRWIHLLAQFAMMYVECP